jgi:hypothetical protein
MATEINVELLLSRRVRATNGRPIGRVEEIVAEERDGECLVVAYLVGVYAAVERLSAWTIGRSILRVVGLRRAGGYRVRWDQLDVSDPTSPRLRCPMDEVEKLDA